MDGSWTKEAVDTSRGAGRYLTMSLDRSGLPIFAYQVQEQGLYRFLRRTASGWQREVISKNDGDGRGARLQEGPNGQIHLVYYGAKTGIFYGRRNPKGEWKHETIAADVQGAHTVMPALHIESDGRITLLFADARMVRTGLQRAERNRAGKWTTQTVDTHFSPGRNAVFMGPAEDPTANWLYTVNGKAWIRRGRRGVGATELILRHASNLRAGNDPDGHLVILTTGTDRSLVHITRRVYLVRYDKRHKRLRHFRIGEVRSVHTDLAISKAGRIVSVFSDEKDGTLYLHNLDPGTY
jgi:hypothetical protein